MHTHVYQAKQSMAQAAARCAAEGLSEAIEQRGEACLILATGASQFEMLAALVQQPVAWPQVTVFHLDEYIGLPDAHPASFRRYLRQRFVELVAASRPPGLKHFYAVNGDAADPAAECRRLGELIAAHPVDVACIGIGENGHLAFNDPPADFTIETPYLVVDLDEACRRQQLGEGWFASLEDVPARAISMSIRQMLKSRQIVCTVPDRRKAGAVFNALQGPLTNRVPASILRTHPTCHLFLDSEAASLLTDHPAV